MDNNFTFFQPWGGLGDNLQFSTLAQLYKERGDKFFVSNENVYRNDEIKKIVWDMNPFVEGFSNMGNNIGLSKVDLIPSEGKNWIEKIEASHGFFNTGNRYPFINYTPKKINDLKNKTILELNCISEFYDQQYIEEVLEKKLDKQEDLLLLKFNNFITSDSRYSKHIIDNVNFLNVDSIFHLCDIMYSCKKYITLYSGSSLLGSALIRDVHNKNIYIIVPKCFIETPIEKRWFYFDNLNYICN